MSKIIFMSHPLDDKTPSYGDRDSLKISPKSKIVNGVGANTSSLLFSNNQWELTWILPIIFRKWKKH